eukprot:7753217-Alexandrium_andersonii.AAC.1
MECRVEAVPRDRLAPVRLPFSEGRFEAVPLARGAGSVPTQTWNGWFRLFRVRTLGSSASCRPQGENRR